MPFLSIETGLWRSTSGSESVYDQVHSGKGKSVNTLNRMEKRAYCTDADRAENGRVKNKKKTSLGWIKSSQDVIEYIEFTQS